MVLAKSYQMFLCEKYAAVKIKTKH